MKRLLILSALLVSASAPCQDLGGAWFLTKGQSQPVALVKLGTLDAVFGTSVTLDVSAMVRPTDGLRLGGCITMSAKTARNLWVTVGVGGLFSERFEWSSVRPGLVLGLTVRF